MKYLKPFLPKDTLLDTTILLIPIFFNEIGFFAGEIFVFWFKIYNCFFYFYIYFHFFFLNL